MNNSQIRNSYNMKKIKKFNNIDQMYNHDEIKNMIIKPQKIEKPNINMKTLVDNKENTNEKDFNESIKKRVNEPYKGIIKDFDYSKIREKHEEDLIVHKVNQEDKNINLFTEKKNNFEQKIAEQNKNIKDTYSLDKKTEHKKEFDYQHKYK